MEIRMNRRSFVKVAACSLAALGFGGASFALADDEEAQMTGDIYVYSREDGSGTRGAFIELMGIEQKNDAGEKVDMTTPDAAITNSTSVMMTTVAGDAQGIGYISLGSLDDSVKALKVDGVEATPENVKNGTYKVARPFNIVVMGDLDEVSQDFVDYILSAEGQAIVEENHYVSVVEDAPEYEASGLSGKIVVAGSSSVTPVMEKLSEAYQELNADVKIEVQQSDSTTGVNMAVEGTCQIGMASRELKDSEVEKGAEAIVIAMDGIAVIVNKDAAIDELRSDQICAIYTGEVTTWEDALAIPEPEKDEDEEKTEESKSGESKSSK